MPKVLIATPSRGLVPALYAVTIANIVRGLDFETAFIVQCSADLISNRIFLVRKAREMGMTHIFFVDDDIAVAPKVNPLKQLLSHDKDIVGCDYNFRQFPIKGMATPLDKKEDKLYKCKVLPTGFMLIKLSVFDKVPEPWFMFGRDDTGVLYVSEDAYFCMKARDAGFDVWCDPTIRVGHVGEFIY